MNLMEIKEALLYGEREHQNAAALFAEGRDREKWKEIRENPFYKDDLQAMRKEGERYLGEPIRSLRFSDFKIFDTTGSRKEYEQEYFDHRGRLNAFAILSMAFGEEKYISALEDAIWTICDEYSWCLPAHLSGESLSVIHKADAVTPDGKNRGSLREHDKVIDLFAAETGYALSEICSLLEDRLAPVVVYRARKLVKERILEAYCQIHSMFGWETWTNNWAAVCAGSVGAAALYLIQDSMALAPVVLKLTNTMEAFLSGFEEDGACTEGLSYWNYGFGFYICFAELLRQRTAGEIDLMRGEKLRQISLFQQKCYLSGNKVVSFSDGALSSKFQPGITSYLKSRFKEVEIPEISYRRACIDDYCHRWASDSRNLVWSDPYMESTGVKDASYYLKDAQWLISRKKLGGGMVAFAAKGGHNDEPHNHNDVGNFILHLDGESLVVDTGAGEYTKQYFGPERYTILCNSARGHSVPVINGEYQKTGREYAADILEQSCTEDRDVFVLDIARAYQAENLVSLVRKFDFEKNMQPKLVLKDMYNFTDTPVSVVERFVSFRAPRLLEPGKIEIRGETGSVIAAYDHEQLVFSVEKDVFMDHKAKAQDIYLMNLAVKNPGREFTTKITFELKTV